LSRRILNAGSTLAPPATTSRKSAAPTSVVGSDVVTFQRKASGNHVAVRDHEPRAASDRLQDVSMTGVDSRGLQRVWEDRFATSNTNEVKRLGTKTERHQWFRETRLNEFESLPHRQNSLILKQF
jgi:hypothetical protein